ncbi:MULTISPECIES: CHASE domain-containing protein [Bradyrhizobium]|jgi:signal transduction histidine kinase/ActR/RegA family two-component response regulator|uniref:CHASE domain-containing protein n=1 Tax=Bradyrhizobium TaxID=374 RepID=UPI0004652290|nr:MULTISPECIES: CHASE domain-containing protein [Bradyrhizobium]OCX29169.1 hypothetical protein QU42_19760 [Bradyrhizobium sp. UASWS1016]
MIPSKTASLRTVVSRRPRIQVLVILVVGFGASLLAYNVGVNFDNARARASFERAAGDRIAAVHSSISSTIGSLRALASFFEATGDVTDEQFRRFVSPLLAVHPGVQAYEWVPRVEQRERAAMERGATGMRPEFRITERDSSGTMVSAGKRDIYYPVYFAEPLSGNRAAVGFDLFSNEARRAAIEQAVKSGAPQATARITLVQETGNQYGFLVFVPVFQFGDGDGGALRGLVIGVFRIGDVIGRATDQSGREDGIEVKVWDRSAPPQESLLFPRGAGSSQPGGGLQISTSRDLNVGGRRWEIVASATPAYLAREGSPFRFAFVAAVVLVTINLAWILHRRFMFEDEVIARTAEMRSARDEAQQANRVKSNFLATMSHEIRTPMNAIIAMADHLLEGELLPAQETSLQIITKSSEHLLHVINDILDLSKLEARKIEFEKRTISIEKTISSVVNMLSTNARDKGITIHSQIAENVPDNVVGDPARLRQILLNLASNAVKFTEKGGVTIRVAAEEGVRGPIVPLVMTVSDTGIGMSEGAIENLFTEFWQADNSISRRYGGTGLGLAITRRLTTQMGGSISVKSVPGEGSEFTVKLPFGRAARAIAPIASASRPQDVSDASDLRSVQILLVEDNLTNRDIARKILGRFGADVTVACDGLEAVKAASARRYDIILMDVHMPNMNGLEAARAIRNLKQPFRNVPIVALTASAFAEDRAQCFEAGMDDFCPKPYRGRELVAAIKRVASSGAAGRQGPVVAA